jgi:hypothetical protein
LKKENKLSVHTPVHEQKSATICECMKIVLRLQQWEIKERNDGDGGGGLNKRNKKWKEIKNMQLAWFHVKLLKHWDVVAHFKCS